MCVCLFIIVAGNKDANTANMQQQLTQQQQQSRPGSVNKGEHLYCFKCFFIIILEFICLMIRTFLLLLYYGTKENKMK